MISLEQNYRSHGNILDAANALISHNARRLGKNLWTAAGAGEPLRVFEAQSDADEARWMVEEIAGAARARARGAPTIAVLYRSQRAVARAGASRCSTPGSPIASTAACASSSAPR